MSISLVQIKLGGNNSTSGNSVSAAAHFDNATTAGNFLILVGFITNIGSTQNGSDSVSTPGLSGNSVWSPFNGESFPSFPNRVEVSIWSSFNAPSIPISTNTTYQVNFGGSSGTKTIEFILAEFSGVSQNFSSYFDVGNQSGSAGSSTPTSGNITTTKSDLIVTGFTGLSSGSLTQPSGFTLGPGLAAVQFGQMAYLVNSSVGLINMSWSGGTESPWAAATSAFLPPAVVPQGVNQGMLIGF